MYTPPPFKPDRAAALSFAGLRGFGTACAWDGEKPVASALPFLLDYGADGTPQLGFHLARNNPLLRLADGVTPWLMAVNGSDAYVSADWYVSPDQVPTGPVRVLGDDELGPHLDALSGKFEDWLLPKRPWTSGKMAAGRLDAMKKAIVGVVMAVDEVEGSFKLNQHKSDADYAAVAAALSMQPDAAARKLAEEMRALRPMLYADEVTQLNAMPILEGIS